MKNSVHSLLGFWGDDFANIFGFCVKEMEGRMKDKKPGVLSDELRIALGMPVGHVSCSIFSFHGHIYLSLSLHV